MKMPGKFAIVGAAAVVLTLGSVGALAIADDDPTQQRPSSISVEQPLSETNSVPNRQAVPQQPEPAQIPDSRYDDDWDDRYDDEADDWDDRDGHDDDWDDRNDDDDADDHDDHDDHDDDNDWDD